MLQSRVTNLEQRVKKTQEAKEKAEAEAEEAKE